MKIGKNFFAVIFIVGALLLFPAHTARADYWGAAIMSAFIQRQLDSAYDYIQGTLLGSLKVAAYRTISQQVNSLISGGGAGGIGGAREVGAQFITNWENFIYQDAVYRAQVSINDFYTLSLRGMGVSSYVPANSSFTNGSSRMNWPRYLQQEAQQALSNEIPQYDLNRYCSDPSVMFDSGDLRCLNAYVKPMNNPYGYTLEAQERYAEMVQKNIEIAKTQAIAYQGYKGVTDEQGNTLTPGSTIAEMQAAMNSHLLGMPLYAKNPSEIAAMTASTFINSLLQQVIQQGMVQIESEVQNKISNGMNVLADKLGPAGQLLPFNQVAADFAGASANTVKWSLGTAVGASASGLYTPITNPPTAVPGNVGWKIGQPRATPVR